MKPAAKVTFPLSRADISHFDYHWFWGLQYNPVVRVPNMARRLDALMGDEGLLQSLREQHRRMEKYPFIVRAFYRLFNINHCTFNTYTLVFLEAYKAHQAQEKKDMHSDATVGTLEKERAPSWMQWAQDSIIHLCKLNGLLDTERKDDVVMEMVPQEIPQGTWVDVADALSPQFKVTEEMQPYLKVLGISLNLHDSLTEADVKRAYRKALLVTHPDKGGSPEMFRKLQAAKKQLDWLLAPEENCSISGDDYYRDAMDEIIRSYDNIMRTYDRIDRTYDNIERNLDKIERLLAEEISRTVLVVHEVAPMPADVENDDNVRPYKMICN